MKAKHSFCGLNERRVLPTIGHFGEKLTATLLKGDVVSHTGEFEFADVVNSKVQVAIQVKASNGRHGARILPAQIDRLHKEVFDTPFLFNRGVYSIVFYNGVYVTKKKKGKSKIWSRKHSRSQRFRILTAELQRIYILDVQFLHMLLEECRKLIVPEAVHTLIKECGALIREGAIVSSKGKKNREKVMFLNRTFLGRFRKENRPGAAERALLTKTFGEGRWCLKTLKVRIRFKGEWEGFEMDIPVHYVGSRLTAAPFTKLIDEKNVVELQFEHEKELVA